jgi:hypothetical protein
MVWLVKLVTAGRARRCSSNRKSAGWLGAKSKTLKRKCNIQKKWVNKAARKQAWPLWQHGCKTCEPKKGVGRPDLRLSGELGEEERLKGWKIEILRSAGNSGGIPGILIPQRRAFMSRRQITALLLHPPPFSHTCHGMVSPVHVHSRFGHLRL